METKQEGGSQDKVPLKDLCEVLGFHSTVETRNDVTTRTTKNAQCVTSIFAENIWPLNTLSLLRLRDTLLNGDINTENDNGYTVDEQNSSPFGEINSPGISNSVPDLRKSVSIGCLKWFNYVSSYKSHRFTLHFQDKLCG